jgi:hypothetical protein
MAVVTPGFAGWQSPVGGAVGHGAIIRPFAANGHMLFRPRPALPPLAGIIHERAGRSPTLTTFGHTNTAAGLPPRGYVLQGLGPAGPWRYGRDRGGVRTARRFAVDAYGRRRYDIAPIGTLAGGAFPTAVTGEDTGGYIAPTPTYAYAEAPLAARYGEPSLDQADDAGYGGLPLPSSAPQIIVVNGDKAAPPATPCPCRPTAAASPVVYRYGVGTAY